MARFKTRVLGLVAVIAIAIAIAFIGFWQEDLSTAQAAEDETTYTVESGDSLYSIAREHHISIYALATANGLKTTAILYRKQDLTIPKPAAAGGTMQDAWSPSTATPAEEEMDEATAEATEEATEEPDEEAVGEAVEEEADVAATDDASEEEVDQAEADEEEAIEADEADSEATPAPAEEAMSAATAAPVTYKVKSGDSLYSIAKKHHISVAALAAANNLTPQSFLSRGMTLTIPSQGAASAEAAPAPTAEPAEEATEETTEEAEEEATEEATEEANAEEANAEEPTAEATEEAAAEATTEATAEPTEEPATEESADAATDEATAEATEEATEVATEEAATEEATAEATEEPTEEATVEPTIAATEEPTETATITPTEVISEAANILESLEQQGDFTTLLSALDAAGLQETLTTEGPFTLFAPNDAAFDALPAGAVDGLLASSPDDLSQILLYHLVPGEVFAADLTDGTIIVTAQGGTVVITNSPDGLQVNNANIITSDIQTGNGVIHIIDAVLIPSAGTASVPIGTDAGANPEAASGDAASVIIAPRSMTDTIAAARFWPDPAVPIALFSPVGGGAYHSPIAITGLSKTADGSLAVTLVTADGALLAQRMTVGGAGDYGFFQTEIRFNVNEVTDAKLSIIELDMAEGSILTSLDSQIVLLPGQRVIDLKSPLVGQSVCDPILVSGYSSTFEGNVVLTLSDLDGAVLTQIPTTGGSMGNYRDFAMPLPYAVEEATPLLVSVAESDASGRFPTIDNTVVPVTLYPRISSVCY